MASIEKPYAEKKPVSVGLFGNVAEILPEILKRGIKPDLLTDQTSAHDPVNGYLPIGWSIAEWEAKRESDKRERQARATSESDKRERQARATSESDKQAMESRIGLVIAKCRVHGMAR